MSEAITTTEHARIQKWVEERGGRPAKISTRGKGGGILRIDFGEPEPEFETIKWKEFFEIFDENKLGFLHQAKTENGQQSRFNKFVELD